MVDPRENGEIEDLLRRIGRGEREAFESFYDRFSALIYSTALRVLNSSQEAEDVTQEVFHMIWEKAPLYDSSRGKPLTWAITITRNKSIDRLRSLQRRHRLQDGLEQEIDRREVFAEREPFDELDHHEKGLRVRSAVFKLNKAQREAIEMAYFRGLTQQEIASRLSEPLGTIKARIRRGMLQLKKLIGRAG